MSRRQAQVQEGPGQDSFLDVVANLVGVLIILVMVVGTQARTAIESSVAAAVPQPKTAAELEHAKKLLADEEAGLRDARRKLADQQREVSYRRGERDQFLTLTTAVQHQLAAARQKLNNTDQEEVTLKLAVNQAQRELDQLSQQALVVAAETSRVEVLKHYPTPIAQTVFGQELHFRLAGGRLTYVPFDEFVRLLKEDAPRRVSKLRETERVTETIGPIEGFYMKYALRRETVAVGSSHARQERAALEQFVLIPTNENLGEPLAQALAPDSHFRTLLKERDPRRCTVTVWVYPDAFGTFRSVREELLKLGFTSAARPMPDGHPIGGSPDGSRSAAQ